MKDDQKRKEALDLIWGNIERHGLHIYVVSGGPEPRFAYTIGLSERVGTELVLAGAISYLAEDVLHIINHIAAKMTSADAARGTIFDLGSLGSFSLRPVDGSWSRTLLLGALDFYQCDQIPGMQIIPDKAHWTIDIPDLNVPMQKDTRSAWRWFHEQWTYSVPSASVGVTNLDALRGGRITEVVRWEEDEWEIFAGAGPDVPKEEVRIVPIDVLIAADRSLLPILELGIGEGLWRDSSSGWHRWVNKN